MKKTRAREAKQGYDKKQQQKNVKQTSRVTSSAAAFCGLAGSVQVEAVAGLKLLQLEPLEGFGPPGLGLHGLPFYLNHFARLIEWHYLFRLISFYT